MAYAAERQLPFDSKFYESDVEPNGVLEKTVVFTSIIMQTALCRAIHQD